MRGSSSGAIWRSSRTDPALVEWADDVENADQMWMGRRLLFSCQGQSAEQDSQLNRHLGDLHSILETLSQEFPAQYHADSTMSPEGLLSHLKMCWQEHATYILYIGQFTELVSWHLFRWVVYVSLLFLLKCFEGMYNNSNWSLVNSNQNSAAIYTLSFTRRISRCFLLTIYAFGECESSAYFHCVVSPSMAKRLRGKASSFLMHLETDTT